MESSDDEGEVVPKFVSDYYFEDGKKEPISFSELPVQWSEEAGPDCCKKNIFVRGKTDNGLLPFHRQVSAWKYDLTGAKPEISVLFKENNWIKLQKPRKSYEDIIRTVLITVHCLHFFKRNPQAPWKSLWYQLYRVFSSYERRPSENDLIDHIDFINEAVKRDETLAKSKYLIAFLKEKPRKRKNADEVAGTSSIHGFIVDDIIDEFDDDIPRNDLDGDDSEEETDAFDSVCAICDNGGELLCCEGRCLRSFHATKKDGSDSQCKSLGFTAQQVEAIQTFLCANCRYDMHQCFVCGELGSSKKPTGAEVFQCSSATCGHFYHPQCVAKLLHRESEVEAKNIQQKIAAGDSFTCPVHKCAICKKAEDETNYDLQFATCRRCPNSYHRKCLPSMIVFGDDSDDEDVIQRAWSDLLPKSRILIYCMKHDIDVDMSTPIRDHIKFPNFRPKKKKQSTEPQSSTRDVAFKEKNNVLKRMSSLKPSEGFETFSSIEKQTDSSKKRVEKLSRPESSKKQKVVDTSQKALNKSSSTKVNKIVTDGNRMSLGDRLYDHMIRGSELVKSKKDEAAVGEHEHTQTSKPPAKGVSNLPPLDNDSKNRILVMMKEATSSVTLEEVIEKHKVPTTHAYSSRNIVDKSITLGKVEACVEALRLAVKKLEEGCSIEDAKAVCDPVVLQQISRWKGKLKVYLAPFLHGMRYTSFGRHFTKVDKLKEIADVLKWYVQEGDTIVDFCCGANDFSCLMKKRLDEMGKQCSYKNYDAIQAKNDFNFEKRDWMTVHTKELPLGSQLIMGLNPPFGVNAALANKFIDKALQFKPKLLILIVPPETERLDRKKPPYDLVWEDGLLLAGKSFYLPGSVDVDDKQMDQWNNIAPPLYLWSRQDWTSKHKAIATRQGHISRARDNSGIVEALDVVNIPTKHELKPEVHTTSYNQPVAINERKRIPEKATAGVTGSCKSQPSDLDATEVRRENLAHRKVGSNEKSIKRSGKGKRGWGSEEVTPENKQTERNSTRHHSLPRELPMHTDTGLERHEHFDRTQSSSRHERAYNRTADERSSTITEEPYTGSTYGGRLDDATIGHDSRIRSPEVQYSVYQQEGMDSLGYNNRPCMADGRSSLSHRDGYYLRSHESGLSAPYGHHGVAANNPPYNGMSTSTMQRYAPRLDELNPARINSLGSSELSAVNRNGAYDRLVSRHVAYDRPVSISGPYDPVPRPRPYDRPVPMPGAYDHPPVPRPGQYDHHPVSSRPEYHQVNALGFTPGTYGPFSQNNPSGWLNE